MPSQSRSANRSSTDPAALLVAGAVLSAVAGAVGLVLDIEALAAVGVVAGTAFAGAFAIYLIVTERRRHEVAEDALQAQASYLESLADENARLLEEAREREDERAQLTEQVITAEQDERRRVSLFLHDGPLQSMSGIALMHDAALAAIRDGRYEDAERVIETSLERERKTIQELRDLSFAIEPLVLRDQGFHAAVRALGDQIEQSYRITVSTNVRAGDRLGEKTQAALYQIIREAVNQAVRRSPDNIEVGVGELEDGGFAIEISDDGVGERRRASIEAIEERVRVLNGRFSVEHGDGAGTMVRVVIPGYVAAVQG
jgi:two-component system, NarL family, sensor kinase